MRLRSCALRRTLALCAFTDAVIGEMSVAAAIAEVLGLTAAERDDQVAAFLSSSHHGEAPLKAFHSFVPLTTPRRPPFSG